VSEILLNPFSATEDDKGLDINVRYMDPFNSRGLFAPLMTLAGASGTNPFDYILDFTQFSPDFGYSNLLINAAEPLIAGKGKFSQNLSPLERISGFVDAIGPTSFTKDLPRLLDPTKDNRTRFKAALRFFGLDVEERNPNYIRTQVRDFMKVRVKRGEDLTPAINALNIMGFDGERIAKNVIKTERRKRRKQITGGELSHRQQAVKTALENLGVNL